MGKSVNIHNVFTMHFTRACLFVHIKSPDRCLSWTISAFMIFSRKAKVTWVLKIEKYCTTTHCH